jgi:hypothetical protein
VREELHQRNSLSLSSLSLSHALIFIRIAKFDFYTASKGGAMKLGSCRRYLSLRLTWLIFLLSIACRRFLKFIYLSYGSFFVRDICKGKANMRNAVPVQKVPDDLYTHDILEYKLDEIYMISNNRISTLPA